MLLCTSTLLLASCKISVSPDMKYPSTQSAAEMPSLLIEITQYHYGLVPAVLLRYYKSAQKGTISSCNLCIMTMHLCCTVILKLSIFYSLSYRYCIAVRNQYDLEL